MRPELVAVPPTSQSPATPLCKGAAPFRGGGSAAARQRAPLARVQSKLHQPPTTPCMYLASPAWCTSHFEKLYRTRAATDRVSTAALTGRGTKSSGCVFEDGEPPAFVHIGSQSSNRRETCCSSVILAMKRAEYGECISTHGQTARPPSHLGTRRDCSEGARLAVQYLLPAAQRRPAAV
jgi:hypothetical protein